MGVSMTRAESKHKTRTRARTSSSRPRTSARYRFHARSVRTGECRFLLRSRVSVRPCQTVPVVPVAPDSHTLPRVGDPAQEPFLPCRRSIARAQIS